MSDPLRNDPLKNDLLMSEALIEWDVVQSIKNLGLRINKPDYWVKILSVFESQSGQMLDQMEKSIKENSLSSLEQIAHSMKGSSLCMGAKRLAAICSRMEQDFRTKNANCDDLSVAHLAETVEKVKEIYLESIASLKRQIEFNDHT